MPAACRTLGHVVILDQILFISGVTLTIGLKSSMQFFTKRSNFKVYTLCLFHIMMFLFYIPPYGFRVVQGTISFALGFLLVMIGWPVLGMILEAYGFIVLFSGFWPTLAVFVQKIPVLGWVFQQPFVRSVCFLDMQHSDFSRNLQWPLSVVFFYKANFVTDSVHNLVLESWGHFCLSALFFLVILTS
ncbi:hypothetical protein RHGRI_030884 [Rhododendron griersonianum]|uniref:Uncharacterized protein n=1 Tax=Rhododendron griersonianum TaxID=479676 RepID=A0AAV6I623_9ERIC|nr:hypothetical protein RHGRI_030884 [Rhododendron griersonianum]